MGLSLVLDPRKKELVATGRFSQMVETAEGPASSECSARDSPVSWFTTL